MLRLLLITAAVLGLVPATAAAATWTVEAPEGDLSATVVQDARGTPLRLEVRRAGAAVLTSDLGLVTSRGQFVRGLEVTGRTDVQVDERYRTPLGKRRDHRLLAAQMTLALRAGTGAALELQVRAAADGVAYRHVVGGSGRIAVFGERGTWRAPAGAEAWLTPWRPNYENIARRSALADAEPDEYAFPALLRTGDTWALLTESDVDGRYAASRLTVRPGAPGALRLTLPQGAVTSELPLATPWRLAVVGDLATVVESDLPLDLGAPSRLPDASWVRPGLSAWSWWSDGSSPRDPEVQRRYVDYAASVGWEYVLVDEGWSPEWLPGLVAYARERGVEVIAWARWDDLDTEAERQALLPLWKSWGVAGVKLDFINADTQERMQWYEDVAEDTAALRLLVNFHGSTVPRGIQRTWPHVVTLEGVRGAEDYNLGFLTPEHNVTLPFTRGTIGSMDYTPVTFSAARRETSAGHELALAVVYESGIQHPADSVEEYGGRGVAEAVLERLPAAWDETELLRGAPGEEATLARRAGEDWWLGSITAGPARTLDVPLEFLAPGRRYVAEVVDDSGPDELVVRRRVVGQGDRLRVTVSRNGGFTACLRPEAGPATRCLDPRRLARLEVRTGRRFVAPGEAVRATVALTNRGDAPLERPRLALRAPEGWTARLERGASEGPLAPGATARATYTLTAPAAAEAASAVGLPATASYALAGRATTRATAGTVRIAPGPAPGGGPFLSELEPFDSFNSVGPLERDRANGGDEESDGGPLTIEGRVFARGLGGHAHSEQRWYLGERCTRLTAVVGIDDEVGESGRAVFQVWADDAKRFDSGPLTGADPGVPVDVDLRGVEELKLVLGDAGDPTDPDHGDWADARLACAP